MEPEPVAGQSPAMRVLVVDDSERVRKTLATGLRGHGMAVETAADGAEALTMLNGLAFDLVVLDLMMPHVDGVQVLRALKVRAERPRILVLSARDQVQDRVHGLELGADDYMVKPFAFAELLARVRIHLRRGSKAKDSDFLRAADLELDLLRRRVTRAGKRIDLTAKEFALLELLLRRQGEVLPRSLIASQVWDMNFDSDTNVIEVAIKRLRLKIDEGFEPKLIRTVRGMGYVLEVAD